MDSWRWGQAHQARFAHPLFSHIPLYEEFFGFAVPTSGGGDTVNRAVPRFSAPPDERFADIHGPGFRAIYNLGNLDQSRFMIATGQSGNPLSPFYGSLARRWSDGDYVKLVGDDKAAIYRLVLNPG